MMSDMEITPIVPTQQEEEWRRWQDWIVRAILDQFNIAPQILGIDGRTIESTAVVLPDEQVLLPELVQSKQERNN